MSRFQGINFPNDVGTRKMGLDLLGKINQVWSEVFDPLDPSEAVQTDASGGLTTIPNTGTGSNVLNDSPTLINPSITGSIIMTDLSASQAVQTDASKALTTIPNTGTGNNVLQTSPTIRSSLLVSDTTGGAAMPTPETGTLLQMGNSNGVDTQVELISWGAASGSLLGRRIGGTIAAPSATANNNLLLTLDGLGRGATIYTGVTSRIALVADQAFTDSANGTRLVFSTTLNGSTSLAEAWRISNNGALSNNLATGSAYIHLKAGVAAAGGAPIKFTAGTNLTAAEAGAFEWDGVNAFLTRTTGPTRKQLTMIDTNAVSSSTPADPTGASTTALMMGLAGAITPLWSTRVIITISGQMSNNTVNDGVSVRLRYGTGTAPTNGAASTGNQAGATQTATSLVAAQRSGFSISVPVTGLTAGTAYWIDASVQAITGGTANIFGVTISAIEV